MKNIASGNIFSVDRHEGALLVCVCDDGRVFELPADTGLEDGDVFSANVSSQNDQTLTDIKPMPEETARRKKEARDRLDRLLNRRNK